MLTEVKINGIDISSSVISWKLEDEFGVSVKEISLTLKKNITEPINGQTLTIKRGKSSATEQFILDGYVTEIQKDSGKYVIYGKDKLFDLIRNEITYSYDKNIDLNLDGKISDIFKDLVNTYGGGVLVADDTSVQNSGTVNILTKFICNHEDVYKKCEELSEILDWQFYYNEDDGKVYFEPKGFLGEGTGLTVGTNCRKRLKWKYDSTELLNEVNVFGAKQDVQQEKYHNGDASETEFALDFEPTDIRVEHPIGTVLQGGLEDDPNSEYHVDKQRKLVIFDSPPALGTNNIYFRYSYSIPVPVTGYNQASISEYMKHKKTFFFEDIATVEDAEMKVQSLLNKYALPFISTSIIPMTDYSLKAGQTVQVTDSENDEDRILLINTIVKKYPHTGDIISVGDRIWKTADWQTEVVDRIQKIEEENARISDYLVHIINIGHALNLRRKELQIWRKRVIGVTGIYGHASQGIYGLAWYGYSGMIWGHAQLGIWNQVKWGSSPVSFVLGHVTAGVLGTSKLGEGNVPNWELVYDEEYN